MDNGQPACLVKACVLEAGGQWTMENGKWKMENGE